MKPDVSVIMAAKIDSDQKLEWLGDAIQSVTDQYHKNWELIVVNDHSEVSWNPLREMFSDERIHGTKSGWIQGPGVSAARNTAAAMAHSDLLLPLDADDMLPDTAIEDLLRVWKQEGHKHGIVYGDTLFLTRDGQKVYQSPPYDFDKLLQELLLPVGALHRKADWQRSGGWKSLMDEGLEDWEYWITLGELGVCGYHYGGITYHYRRHPQGRLAQLRTTGEYDIAYQRMRQLHISTYNGRRPMGCCGGKTAKAPSQVQAHAARAAKAAHPAPPSGQVQLAQVMYTGSMQDFFVTGRPSGTKYSVSRAGESLRIARDGRQGVLPQDVPHLESMDRGRSFRRVS